MLPFFFLAVVDCFISQSFPEDFNFFSHLCFIEFWEYFKGSSDISKWRFSYLNVCISLHICFDRMLLYFFFNAVANFKIFFTILLLFFLGKMAFKIQMDIQNPLFTISELFWFEVSKC